MSDTRKFDSQAKPKKQLAYFRNWNCVLSFTLWIPLWRTFLNSFLFHALLSRARSLFLSFFSFSSSQVQVQLIGHDQIRLSLVLVWYIFNTCATQKVIILISAQFPYYERAFTCFFVCDRKTHTQLEKERRWYS